MPASSRTVYGREFTVTPVWMWLLQRASGVLLGPLVALHIWAPAMAANRLLNAFLLAIILAHGYTGLRRVAVRQNKIGMTLAITVVWCAIVAFFGLLLVVYR